MTYYTPRRLRKRGYVLVNADRYERVERLKREVNRLYDNNAALVNETYDLHDRIAELEAEVEGHKRVEAHLAERAANAERLVDDE